MSKKIVEQEIVAEFGSSPDDDLYLVSRSFLLRVRNGPLEAVTPGQVVRLTSATGRESFLYGETEPAEIGEVFVILRPIEIVGPDGCWVLAGPGDEVKLARPEAIDFLRKGMVKKRREK